MKKNIVKILIVIVAFFSFCKVNATSFSASGHETYSDSVAGVTKYGHAYANWHFQLTVNGKNATEVYCPDLTYPLGYSTGTCGTDSLTSGQLNALNWLYNNKGNMQHWEFQLALRYLSIDLNLAKANAVSAIRSIDGTTASAKSSIERAKKLAAEALNHKNDTTVQKTGTKKVQLGSISSEIGKEFKINVTKSNFDAGETVEFKCENCTVANTAWNGDNGEVTVIINDGACEFKLYAEYNDKVDSGAVSCYFAENKQRLIAFLNADIVSTESKNSTSKTYKMSPSNSNYEAWCGEPKLCNEKTKIDIPAYCDSADNQQISITAPKNVVQCILNSKDDADNSYKMDDTQIKNDNPYCAVYCKEDYTIDLPGAKYGDSGRYFQLEDTKVTGKRTCYATGPNSNVKNIDVDTFINEVITLQKEMIATEEVLQYWKALLNAPGIDINSAGCDGKIFKGYKYDATYTGYDLIDCDNATGVCRYRTSTKSVSKSYEYISNAMYIEQVNPSCTYECDTVCRDDPEYVEDERRARYEEAKNKINALRQQLKEKVEHFEDCYNWNNNMCFNPETLFRYEEEYGVDFQQKSLNTSVDATIGYKQFDKNIDNEYNTSIGTPPVVDVNYVSCNESGCDVEKANKISTLREKIYYLKKESVGEATYNNVKKFSTKAPYGLIEDAPGGNNGPGSNYYYLGAVFPIMFKTPTGVYNWSIRFNKLGQRNNYMCKGNNIPTASLGRLDDVAKVINPNNSGVVGTNVEYVCLYIVDCPECVNYCVCPAGNSSCVEYYEQGSKFCRLSDDCPECEVYCYNCIFDGNEATYQYRQISLNDVFPNNRPIGSNWSNAKGQETISKIETNGEEAYKTPEYSYTIDPIQMKQIRDYNRSKGSYVRSDDLKYVSLSGNEDNIHGISNFLNEGKSKYFTEHRRNDVWNASGYNWSSVVDGQGPRWK